MSGAERPKPRAARPPGGSRCSHGLAIAATALFLTAHSAWASGGFLADPMETFIRVALSLPALLLGIGLHEFAHAYIAVRLGDPTPEDEGRLSLNPLDHLDPMGSALILAAYAFQLPLLGWGLPVPVRGSMFRNPIRDMLKVGIAGPMMNLAIGGSAAAACLAFDSIGFGTTLGLPEQAAFRVAIMLRAIVITNLSLAAFNLLPIPPLDGHWVAREFLNADQTRLLAQIEPYGILVLLMLMQTPVLDTPFRFVFQLGIGLMTSWAMLGGYLAAVGVAWYLLIRSLPDFYLRRNDPED
ncbi:MAG: site-2 protease family protein [Candidatus Wallbacteria bacterium]|nr:site-2 protease family protein [Candidatus Wallbacteria bacterium]